MNFSYEDSLEEFYNFINNCRKKINEIEFSENEKLQQSYLRTDLIKKGSISNGSTITNAIRTYRNNLIDIKLEHTMRVVENATQIAKKLNTCIDFEKVLKEAALLHDIARFEQAIYASDFNDRKCALFNGIGHAEYGYQMLYKENIMERFNIPEEYHYAIAQAVKHHQSDKLSGDLLLRFNSTDQLDVSRILTGNRELNEQEKIIVASLVQLVRDVDMVDIFYQHISGDYPVVRDSVSCNVNGRTLKEISSYYGVSPEIIRKHNGLINDDISDRKELYLPITHANPKAFMVSKDIQKMFLKNQDISLSKIISRTDWSFIVGMWWRLNHFLNQISFIPNLELIQEKQLLDQIYNLYPEEYKPLVETAFQYSQENLLDKVINENKGKIYVMKKHLTF